MPATIVDIKKKTGLSLATISKYLNGGNVLPENTRGGLSHDMLRSMLKRLIKRSTTCISPLAMRMLRWLERGKLTFDSLELCDGFLAPGRQSANATGRLREMGIITTTERRRGRYALYAFNLANENGHMRKKLPDANKDISPGKNTSGCLTGAA